VIAFERDAEAKLGRRAALNAFGAGPSDPTVFWLSKQDR
jgi:hypothetical protein